MWTAKRILILTASLLISLGSYSVYAVFLGLIDGVQPLGAEKLPGPDGTRRPPSEPLVDLKLKQGFNANCKELQRPLRLWLPDKQIAFAAGDFTIDAKADGKVRLAPFSAAFFHKSKTPGGYPEISTIRCDVAILTLDKHVSQFSELNNRKVVKVEMVGKQPNNITITNNRRTAEKNDDIDLLITNGDLVYVAIEDRIYTEGVVCLTDHQPKPPTVIFGRGMDLYLAKATNPSRPRPSAKAAPKPGSETGNIEKIALRSDVDMKFWSDPRSGFLGGTPDAGKPPPNGKRTPLEKELIHVHTGGPFVYDLTKEIAWFESPPARESKAGKSPDPFAPDQVHVHRVQKINGGEKFDQLTCDRLDLQFRRKLTPGAAPASAETGDKEIETALATCRDVNEVTLALDSEGMAAFGKEMFYRAGDGANGPLTILKGEPMRPLRTFKDGHAMRSQELHLFAANRFGEGQRGFAKGPGVIDILDGNDPKKNSFPTHVHFRDSLTVVKAQEGGEVFDLMTVVGEASFIDDQQKQELHGDKICVWVRKVQESAKKSDAVGGARQELHRVLAQGRVRATSPEFIVRKSDELTMVFQDGTPRGAVLPQPGGDKKDMPPPLPPGKDMPPTTETKDDKARASAPAEEKKPRAPIEMEGNKITASVFTYLGNKKLQELIANGNVFVFQAGEKEGQKALDIRGARLTVKHFEKGDTMIVFGDKDKPARVEADDTVINGPRITVNQADNHADVDGAGDMTMPSNKNIDGTQTGKKASRITINWNKNMTFDGKVAYFAGGVQVHENGTYNAAKCDSLMAILDQTILFKESNKEKNKQSAKLDRLVFDKEVYIEEYRFDENKQPLQYNKLKGWTLYNREDGPTNVTGPGFVKMLAKGAADQGFMQPPPGVNAKPAPAKEWKLTHVNFSDSMYTNSKANLKKTTFYGSSNGVEVFHFATTDIDAKMDPDRPPENGLYLRCEMLTIEGKEEAGRTTQTMIGERNVHFRTDKYFGSADIVKYVENSDVVILEANPGNQVRLHDQTNKQPVVFNSSKVLYNRRTGKIDTEGVKSIRTN